MKGNNCATDILRQDIVEDAYCIVENLIRRICWKFHKRFGGEFEEWLSESNEIFMETVRDHNPEKASLITFLYHRLNFGLYRRLSESNINKRVKCHDGEIGVITQAHGGKVTVEFADGCRREMPIRAVEFAEPVTLGVLESETGAVLGDILEARASQSLLSLISDNGVELLSLILDPPNELKAVISESSPRGSWYAIRRYCKYTRQWTSEEVRTSIAELRELCTE